MFWLRKLFRSFLFWAVTSGCLLLLFLTVFIYWMEYEWKKQDDFLKRLLPDTQWVQSKFPLYFVLGTALGRINLDGSDLKFLYEGDSPIQQFIFSPNGRHLLIVTRTDLFQYDQKKRQIHRIDSLGKLVKEYKANGIFRTVQWSPDGQKVCYELYRWSPYSSQDLFYVYSLKEQKKRLLQMPVPTVSSIFWDQKGEHLYCYDAQLIQGSSTGRRYKLRIYRIPLADLKGQLVTSFFSKTDVLKESDLGSLGIDPYFLNPRFVSYRAGQKSLSWISEKKRRLGLDEKDYLYWADLQGKPVRLFRIRKKPLPLVHLRWVPGGRYVVMTHNAQGILVLEPRSGKLGKLMDGQAFGWYQKEGGGNE